ncbi:MAG: extracellular solute-binding protein [Roseburia sp.]|nr:extracellular solute-binding protein [Roseburia sp.]
MSLAGILTISMFSGCGRKDYSKLLNRESPVTISVWHYYNGIQQMQFDEMVSEFNNTVGSEQGIIVEANSKNSVNELAESVMSSANREAGADVMPNIFATYAETAYQIDKLGMLVDLSKYFTAEEMEEYVGDYMEEGALGQEGALKIFPTAKSTEIMMLNLTDWQKFADECGITYQDLSTWEGVVEVSEKYYHYTDELTPDIPDDGKAFFGRDSVANYLIVGAKQLGHEFVHVSKEGKVTSSMDRETVRRLWENFYVPYVKGYFNAESRFRTDDAKIGSIIALIGSTTGATYYPSEVTINDEYSYPIENVVLPVPNFEGSEPYIVQQGAGMSVTKSDERTEYACAVFLSWFTEAERNIDFAVNSGYLPVKKEANDFQVISPHCTAAGISETMLNTFETAINEINGYTLYTSPPYDESARVRDYLGEFMESTAKSSRAAAQERISGGEDRERVWNAYTGDEAFDVWFAEFEKGFQEIVGE